MQAITTLKKNNSLIIKPSDKGGATVIMNKQAYVQEDRRQLENEVYYSPLDEDPTRVYNANILQVIEQATNLNIIDGNTLYNKFPRIPTF